MATICLNCGKEVTEKYCPNCGQKATVSRLTWHHLFEEIIHFFTHIEHQFFKTTWLNITKPWMVQQNYLDGKRKTYQKPISFLLIWITIYLLVFHFVNRFTDFEDMNTSTVFSNDAAVNLTINKYRTLIEILILPVTTFTGWLIVARPKLNYVEILSVAFYGFSVLFIFLSAEFIIAFIFNINFHTNIFDTLGALIYMCWAFYSSINFYKRYLIPFRVIRVILSLIVGGAIYMYLLKEIAKLFIAWGF